MNSPKRWKPKIFEAYWYIRVTGEVMESVWNGNEMEEKIINFGNCFRTKKSAEKARRGISKLLRRKG